MVENFKTTAVLLKRQLKISIYLPKDYNLNENKYPLIYVLDGQKMFHSLDDNEKLFDLPSILDEMNAKCICVGIHSPKNNEWRISEVCPYYKKDDSDIDPKLSYNLANYIMNDVHSIITDRYRISDNISILGFNESALLALYMTYHFNSINSCGVFSPTLSICENVIDDINNHYDENKNIYLYHGGIDDQNTNHFYNLYTFLEKMKPNKLKLIYEENEDNTFTYWQKHICDFINFIL